MSTCWIIKDWAGNTLFNGQTFESFENGWDHICTFLADLSDDELEETLGEYYVAPIDAKE